VIGDNDEEYEDAGLAPSSGEFLFILHHVNLGLYDLALLGCDTSLEVRDELHKVVCRLHSRPELLSYVAHLLHARLAN